LRFLGRSVECRDKVGHRGRRARSLRGQQAFLDDPVCLRHPLVLPQVLDPRLDEEHLDDAGRVGGILKLVPAQLVIEKQEHRVGGVEKHRRVHVVIVLKGVWATAVASDSEVRGQHDAGSGLTSVPFGTLAGRGG
jgi:hypothetical protein